MKKWMSLLLMICLMAASAVAQAEIRYPEAPAVQTVEELEAYLREAAERGITKMEFYYSEELDYLLGNDERTLCILANAGVRYWKSISKFYYGKRLFQADGIIYYTGMKIVRAWENGRTDWLNEEERQTLEIALAMVERAKKKGDSLMQIERCLHDELCRTIVYTGGVDEQSCESTAVGALLYGTAECDGYADAFYLLGRLAELNVGYFQGETISENPQSAGNHLWNVIELDGLWYHVDVCWDDLDYEKYTLVRYNYFNVSSDMIDDHVWDEQAVLYEPAQEMDWNYCFYTCGESGFGAKCSSFKSAAQHIERRWKNGDAYAYVMMDGIYSSADQLNSAMYKTSVSSSWQTWVEHAGGYTLFHIRFVR